VNRGSGRMLMYPARRGMPWWEEELCLPPARLLAGGWVEMVARPIRRRFSSNVRLDTRLERFVKDLNGA
jgi:hypothetical protein